MSETDRRDLPARTATARTVLLLALMVSIVLSGTIDLYVWVSLHLEHRIDPDDLFPTSVAGAVAVGLTAVMTVVIVAVMRRRAERQGGPVPLHRFPSTSTLDELRSRIDEIAGDLGVRDRFEVRVTALDPRVGAHVRWGPGSRPLVVLSGGLLRARAAEPAAVDAAIAHELAHVRNRDAAPTTIAIAAWRATLLTGVLPTLVILSVESVPWFLRVSALLLVAVVYLVRLEVLRSREYWADIRAAEVGHRSGLLTALGRDRTGPRTVRVFHPTVRARAAALSTSDLSRRVLSLGEALLAGAALGVVLATHLIFWTHLLPPFLGDLTAAYAAGYLSLVPVIPLLLVVARAASSGRARWSVRQGGATVVAMSCGASLGSTVGLGIKADGPAASLTWLGIGPAAVLPGWAPLTSAIAFLVLLVLTIGWCRGVIALWPTTGRARRRALELCLVVYGLLLFSSFQNVGATLLLNLGGWSEVDRATEEAAAAAGNAPWDVVPFWGREIATGGFTSLFSYVDAIALGVVALTVPLVGVLLGHPRPRRAVLAVLAGVVVMTTVGTALAVGILGGIDAVDPAAREQLQQNVHDLQMFVQLVAGLAVAGALALLRRTMPLIVAGCIGTVVSTGALAAYLATRPLRCLVTPAAAGQCGTGWSLADIAEITSFKIAPTLLCCVVAAIVGRLLSLALRRRPEPDAASPADGEPLPLTPKDLLVPAAPSPR